MNLGIWWAIGIWASTLVYGVVVNGSMGRDPAASYGQCIPVAKPEIEESREILRKSYVYPSKNITDLELSALAWGVKQILQLRGGKPLNSLMGIKIIYQDTDDPWNQVSGPVKVNRKWSNKQGMNSLNVGMLFHEIGHYVGNNNVDFEHTGYDGYFRAVPEPCKFSWYSKKKRKEEFAEVFSTFIVNPQNLVEDGSESCRRAFEFFRKNLFPDGILATCQKANSKLN